MVVNLQPLAPLPPVQGVTLGTACAGIKQTSRDDLVLIQVSGEHATCAAVFTKNAFCAAPVLVARDHLAAGAVRYLLINSGNANAGTGAEGLHNALRTCQAVANLQQCPPHAVLPFSTGVIGQRLAVEKIEAALPQAVQALRPDQWSAAARAIMTTDTAPKGCARQVEIAGQTVTLTGIAKGAGMIRPDMATLLAFIGTDVQIAPALLQQALTTAVESSFNRITIDGDTSTNDACVVVASGHSAITIEHEESPAWQPFCEALNDLCRELAQAIVRDGEGATKLITIEVAGGASTAECLTVAYTIAHSPLVKTAFFASDANWGRILAAVGRAGLTHLDITQVQIDLNEVTIVRNGGVAPDYTEAAGQSVMQESEITIRVQLGRGLFTEQIWTCDLSHEYVSINADYRT